MHSCFSGTVFRSVWQAMHSSCMCLLFAKDSFSVLRSRFQLDQLLWSSFLMVRGFHKSSVWHFVQTFVPCIHLSPWMLLWHAVHVPSCAPGALGVDFSPLWHVPHASLACAPRASYFAYFLCSEVVTFTSFFH